jgi:hypothetical protein
VQILLDLDLTHRSCGRRRLLDFLLDLDMANSRVLSWRPTLVEVTRVLSWRPHPREVIWLARKVG